MSQQKGLLSIYGFALIASIVIMAAVGLKAGLADLLTVVVLAGLEVTFSFENAVVNARILQNMSRFWQQMFMTVGIIIAVFAVRMLLPLVIVMTTSALSLSEVVNMAFNDPANYSQHLHHAQPIIASFGGMFLLMVFWDFILAERDVKWLHFLEHVLQKVGRLKNISVILTLGILLGAVYGFVPEARQVDVLTGGLVGLLVYLGINALNSSVDPEKIAEDRTPARKRFRLHPGLVGFLYLELIDASFSLDGVIGSFAITQDILLIAAGLGIGALFVRSITVHMLRRGILAKYRYIDHGAHYAIGLLALLMLVSIWHHVPEYITGLGGIIIIIIAVTDSVFYARRNHDRVL